MSDPTALAGRPFDESDRLLAAGLLKESAVSLRNSVSAGGDGVEARLRLGRLQVRLGLLKKAERTFQDALTFAPASTPSPLKKKIQLALKRLRSRAKIKEAPPIDAGKAAALLKAVAPAAPGVLLGGRMLLEAVEFQPDIELSFRDLRGGEVFGVRLLRRRPGKNCFATTGRIDLALDEADLREPAIELFVRAFADRLRRNTSAMSDAELDSLLETRELANPYLRRHHKIGAANIVDFRVGDGCNLRCTFCTDEYTRGPELFRPTASWFQELARARRNGKTGLLITGNEPTLRNDLPEIVAEARRLGFAQIELSTAGVRLSDRAYLEELLDAGVNVLSVSIHGSDAVTDGIQTGRPEFFAPRLRGFENFIKLVGDRADQERRGIFLKTITVLTRQNLADMPALLDLLDRLEATYAVLCYPWIHGGALARFDEIVPDYAAVADALKPLLPRLSGASGRFALANLPACVMPELSHGRMTSKDIVAHRGSETLRAASIMDPTLMHPEICAS